MAAAEARIVARQRATALQLACQAWSRARADATTCLLLASCAASHASQAALLRAHMGLVANATRRAAVNLASTALRQRRLHGAFACWAGQQASTSKLALASKSLLDDADLPRRLALRRWRRWHDSRVCAALLDAASEGAAADFCASAGGGRQWAAWQWWRYWASSRHTVRTLRL